MMKRPKLIKGKYHWPKESLDELAVLFPVTENRKLAEMFGVSFRTLIRKARELNLEKHEDFRILVPFGEYAKKGAVHPRSIATRFRKGEHVSPETEFRSGHTPWIKGTTYYKREMYRLNKQTR